MSIATELSAPKISANWVRTAGSGIGTFFSCLMAALHESRRAQAEQIIHRYRHLLDDAEPRARSVRKQESAASTSLATETAPTPRRLGLRVFISLVVLGFGVLHVIGWTMLSRAAADRPDRSAMHASYGD